MAYNVKNYTEQGGEVTHIGGKLKIDEGGSIEGLPLIDNQASSTASTVALVKDDLNSLISKLKDSGYMVRDEWNTVSIAKLQPTVYEDHKAIFEANQALISDVDITGDEIIIVADIESMESYESVVGYGEHKWVGILITTGFASIVGMKLNGSEVDESEAASTTAHGGSDGDLVLYLPAETYDGKTFSLWHTGCDERVFTIHIEAPEA